jgi:hypothetical protein
MCLIIFYELLLCVFDALNIYFIGLDIVRALTSRPILFGVHICDFLKLDMPTSVVKG